MAGETSSTFFFAETANKKNAWIPNLIQQSAQTARTEWLVWVDPADVWDTEGHRVPPPAI